MKNWLVFLTILAATAAAFWFYQNLAEPGLTMDNKTMRLISSAFEHQDLIPAKYTCDGENINPPLAFAGVPAAAKSLALVVDDPDAPAGTWVHWLMWNIAPAAGEIGENSVPAGAVEGKTSFGQTGYGGPCPPGGEHRYFFKLYALDKPLNLPPTAAAADLTEAMRGHVLDAVELIGRYRRL